MVTMFAIALIVASPVGTMTAHALGFSMNSHDDTDYGERPSDYGKGGSTTEEKSEPAPAPAPKVEDSGSSNSGGSSNESRNEEPAYNGGNEQNSNQQNDTVQDNNVQEKNDPNDVTTKVEGGQAFRSVMDKEHTQYDVYHKGVSVASFSVTDKDGKKVEFETVTLEKGKDGLWYLNITFAKGVDVKGLVLNLLKGDLAYLAKELGITGIQINGEVVRLTNPETANAGTDKDVGTGKESDSKVTEEKTDKEVKDSGKATEEPAGYRVCWCGEKIAIENAGGLSASEKAEWTAHAKAHIKNGERTNYTDIVNK